MDKNGKKKILYVSLAILIVVGLSFSLGAQYGASKKLSTVPTANAQQQTLSNADFSLFWDAVKVIKERYFDAEKVTDQQILYGAIRGAFESLDDPYSGFFEPTDAKKFHEDLNGSFGGIGAEIGVRSGQIVIVAPLKKTPAERAGLTAGDRILEVNGTSTKGISVEDAVKMIRGEPKTTVTLLIARDSWNEAREVPIERDIIVVPTLEWEMKTGNIGYIKLNNFNANVPSLFRNAAFEMLIQRPNGMVLDLRNNPGGFLDVAIDLGGWFLDRGNLVVKEHYGAEDEDTFFANGNGALAHVPLVVLVNEGSASASEILAGALRDNRNIMLVGEKTFGKGTVQEVRDLNNGATVKISIAEWLTPKGISINKKGLEPDYEVKMTEEDVKQKKDPQLEKAIEVLKKQINLNF